MCVHLRLVMATGNTALSLLQLLVFCILHGQCVSAVNIENSTDDNYLTYVAQNESSLRTNFSSNDFILHEAAIRTLLEEELNKANVSDLEVWDSSEEVDQPTGTPNIFLVTLPGSKSSTTESTTPAASVPPSSTTTELLTTPPQPPSPPPSPPPLPYPVVSAPLDALFDFVLAAARYELIANHSTEEPVPDFKQKFKVKIGPFKVKGHLDASQGRVGDLSSLYRASPVSLKKETGGVLVITAAAGLHTLRVRYGHYSARAGPIRVSGGLTAEASPAALSAEVELRPPCSLRLRALRVSALGPLRVRASGLGLLRSLLPLITRWMNKRLRNVVEPAIVAQLSVLVKERLRRFSC